MTYGHLWSQWIFLRMRNVLDKIVQCTHILFIHSFHWHVQNAMIPCHSQEFLPFLSVMYFFQPPFSINYSSILSHLIFPSISWSTFQSCSSQIHILYPFGNTHFMFNNIIFLKKMCCLWDSGKIWQSHVGHKWHNIARAHCMMDS